MPSRHTQKQKQRHTPPPLSVPAPLSPAYPSPTPHTQLTLILKANWKLLVGWLTSGSMILACGAIWLICTVRLTWSFRPLTMASRSWVGLRGGRGRRGKRSWCNALVQPSCQPGFCSDNVSLLLLDTNNQAAGAIQTTHAPAACSCLSCLYAAVTPLPKNKPVPSGVSLLSLSLSLSPSPCKWLPQCCAPVCRCTAACPSLTAVLPSPWHWLRCLPSPQTQTPSSGRAAAATQARQEGGVRVVTAVDTCEAGHHGLSVVCCARRILSHLQLCSQKTTRVVCMHRTQCS